MGCHSWHGKGGGGYGAGVSLRNINLTLNEIINVIKCGRPGTGTVSYTHLTLPTIA